jgi:hypothetical protein
MPLSRGPASSHTVETSVSATNIWGISQHGKAVEQLIVDLITEPLVATIDEFREVGSGKLVADVTSEAVSIDEPLSSGSPGDLVDWPGGMNGELGAL